MTANEEVPLRITVVSPPPGVLFAVQLGRDDLLAPVRSTHDALVFEFTLRTGPQRGGSPSLRGPAAQGPPAARFIYVNSGRQAGDDRSGWDRRAKVSLESITAKLLTAWRRTPGATLEARIAGTGPDGGPACATIALLGRGWELSA